MVDPTTLQKKQSMVKYNNIYCKCNCNDAGYGYIHSEPYVLYTYYNHSGLAVKASIYLLSLPKQSFMVFLSNYTIKQFCISMAPILIIIVIHSICGVSLNNILQTLKLYS